MSKEELIASALACGMHVMSMSALTSTGQEKSLFEKDLESFLRASRDFKENGRLTKEDY